jgi:hypothetical protein
MCLPWKHPHLDESHGMSPVSGVAELDRGRASRRETTRVDPSPNPRLTRHK